MEFETLESLDRVETDAIVVGISEAVDSTRITELPGSVALPLFASGDLPLKPLETLIIPGTPWIHLDIASTAWNEDEKPYLPKGPSGIGVRSLVEFGLGFGEGV